MPALKKMARFSLVTTKSLSLLESENAYARRVSEICYTPLAERAEENRAKATEQVLSFPLSGGMKEISEEPWAETRTWTL